MLIGRGADVHATDGEGRTALHFAARRGYNEVVKLLLDKTAEPKIQDAKGHTALHFAAGYGSKKVVRMLLEVLSKDVIDVQDEYGQTALHFATRGKQVGGKYEEVRKLLKDMDADPTLKDRAGHIAL
jgi:ankyrin repeat protein